MMRFIPDQAESIVRERDGRRLRAMAAVLCLGALLVGAVLGYVWLQVQRVRVSYELEDIRGLRAELDEQNRKLRLELLSLSSLARVDSAARRLGFTEPARDQVRMAREFVAPKDAADGVALRTAAREERPGSSGGRP